MLCHMCKTCHLLLRAFTMHLCGVQPQRKKQHIRCQVLHMCSQVKSSQTWSLILALKSLRKAQAQLRRGEREGEKHNGTSTTARGHRRRRRRRRGVAARRRCRRLPLPRSSSTRIVASRATARRPEEEGGDAAPSHPLVAVHPRRGGRPRRHRRRAPMSRRHWIWGAWPRCRRDSRPPC